MNIFRMKEAKTNKNGPHLTEFTTDDNSHTVSVCLKHHQPKVKVNVCERMPLKCIKTNQKQQQK